ncbi:MAG: DUF1810 domain-containing protein [Pseudomonadota bacterium]|nr:DUF1810 domain-containing protein [Pseudomonadota bacterium]
MDTQFNLERFVEAQAPVYASVVKELKAGHKSSHWMWFVFPQIAGLGHSAMAQKYAIASADEAAAYLAHRLLGARLRECSALVAAIDDQPIEHIFAPPDDRKFHSSMTLFAEVAPDEAIFHECLNQFFDGEPDQATIDRL